MFRALTNPSGFLKTEFRVLGSGLRCLGCRGLGFNVSFVAFYAGLEPPHILFASESCHAMWGGFREFGASGMFWYTRGFATSTNSHTPAGAAGRFPRFMTNDFPAIVNPRFPLK